MATYGGTDTQGLANADYRGRSEKLKAQMDLAEQTNKSLQGAGQSIHQGLAEGQQAQFQQDEAAKGRQLEAARSGLELDPKSGKYVESGLAREKRGFEQTLKYKEYETERDYKAAHALNEQAETQLKAKTFNAEYGPGGLKQAHADIEAGKLQVAADREYRLTEQFNTETGEKREKARFELNKSTKDSAQKLTDQMIKVQQGDRTARSDASAMLQIAAAGNPALRQALSRTNEGKGTIEDDKQIIATLQTQRDQVLLSGLAKTGDASGLEDPNSPMMQDYYQFRNLFTRRMENDMAAESEILRKLPEGEREGFKEYLRMTPKTQEERVRLANKAAAQGFLGITMARRAAAAGGQQGGGQSGAGSTGSTKQGAVKPPDIYGGQGQQSQPWRAPNSGTGGLDERAFRKPGY